jgi:predicted  nucleic acid-binding Zn-ribbon protein
MPHQCVTCGLFYPDKSDQILKGCAKCGGKLFFYAKKGKEDLMVSQRNSLLSPEQREQVKTDVYGLIGDELDRDAPVVLDLESIKINKPGQYELDLVTLFKDGEPIVYKLEEGKYVIDLVETFRKLKK